MRLLPWLNLRFQVKPVAAFEQIPAFLLCETCRCASL